MQSVQYEAPSGNGNHHQFLSESFDRRTLLDMEAALDRASRTLPTDRHDHNSRTFIANKIIACVVGGASSQDAMTRAGLDAVKELERQTLR
jgi:hypothetical protein